eukprot:TRINITY_DN10158_c0_g1_i1.p1 TRINITY_DN10158_c0_g1~~TRINITY_DN10158_c0_g1_i1.p1  ORF type:complete len:140 (-),score=32.57 TRINITY_DN10158_c0_g1_i1:205-591(-)
MSLDGLYRGQGKEFFFDLNLCEGRSQLSIRSTNEHPNYNVNALHLKLSKAVTRGEYGPTYSGEFKAEGDVVTITFDHYYETGGKLLKEKDIQEKLIVKKTGESFHIQQTVQSPFPIPQDLVFNFYLSV